VYAELDFPLNEAYVYCVAVRKDIVGRRPTAAKRPATSATAESGGGSVRDEGARLARPAYRMSSDRLLGARPRSNSKWWWWW
jgi:hypothetical protein